MIFGSCLTADQLVPQILLICKQDEPKVPGCFHSVEIIKIEIVLASSPHRNLKTQHKYERSGTSTNVVARTTYFRRQAGEGLMLYVDVAYEGTDASRLSHSQLEE